VASISDNNRWPTAGGMSPSQRWAASLLSGSKLVCRQGGILVKTAGGPLAASTPP